MLHKFSKVALLSFGFSFTAIFTMMFFSTSAPITTTIAADDCQMFSETGHQVCGRFLDYWRKNGGLAQQGFPISDVFDEKNADPPAGDGKVHKVQYFQRARFEEHLENQPPYDVLLGLLGSEQYQAKYQAKQNGTPLVQVFGKRNETKIDIYTPRAGFIYLVVDFQLNNTSGTELSTNSLYLKVKTDAGFEYEPADASYRLPKDLKLGKLQPGESVRAELAFEVPTGETPKTISFDDYNHKGTANL